MADRLILKGVRQNNLKGIDLEIPLGRTTIITGPSGSGKSSLAFETIFAEGQRRYMESLSTYARQFLDKFRQPDVDSIENIPPTIALEQLNPVRNSRATGEPPPSSMIISAYSSKSWEPPIVKTANCRWQNNFHRTCSQNCGVNIQKRLSLSHSRFR